MVASATGGEFGDRHNVPPTWGAGAQRAVPGAPRKVLPGEPGTALLPQPPRGWELRGHRRRPDTGRDSAPLSVLPQPSEPSAPHLCLLLSASLCPRWAYSPPSVPAVRLRLCLRLCLCVPLFLFLLPPLVNRSFRKPSSPVSGGFWSWLESCHAALGEVDVPGVPRWLGAGSPIPWASSPQSGESACPALRTHCPPDPSPSGPGPHARRMWRSGRGAGSEPGTGSLASCSGRRGRCSCPAPSPTAERPEALQGWWLAERV